MGKASPAGVALWEQDFRALVEHSPDVIARFDSTLRHLYVSPAVEHVTGIPPQKFLGKTNRELGMPQRLADLWEAKLMQVLTSGLQESFEFAISGPRGKRFYQALIVPESASGGAVKTVLGIARDITERRQAEVNLRHLSHQLLRVQETERRALARELHDELGQLLTLLKLNLQSLRAGHNGRDARLEDSLSLIDTCLEQVRELSFELWPAMLEELGLEDTLRWYIKRQTTRGGPAIQLTADRLIPSLSSEQATACFRIVQEALTNVVRHAQAQHVHIEVRQQGTALSLSIRDDGKGFDLPEVQERMRRGKSFGMLGMQERVQLLGGQIAIRSEPRQGTEIRVRFPLDGPPPVPHLS